MKITGKLWIGIIILAAFSPLGLLLPAYFKAGPAWGEVRFLSPWNAPIPDYAFKGYGMKGFLQSGFGYILSAVTGIIAVAALIWFITKILVKK